MRLINIAFFLICFSCEIAVSQSRNQSTIDFAVAAGSGFSPAFSAQKLWGFGKNGKFKIGTGIRLTYFGSGSKDLITAPARITSRQTGPQVLFSKIYEESLDTLKLPNTSVIYLNIPIHLQYSFNDHFEIGFNIDALGLSFGKKQTGIFRASDSKSLNNSSQSAKPTLINVLLVSDNDIGSLNSELYARYWVKENIGIKAGISFQFIEYRTENILTLENDRFRSKNLLPMVSVSYKF